MSVKYRKPRPLTWKSFLLLFIVIFIAGVLKAKEIIRPHVSVPTATVPSVTYEEAQNVPNTELTPPVSESITEADPASSEDASSVEITEPAQPGTNETSAIPLTFNLAVPFTSQAPYGVWDPMHEETCEEASFYMVDEFFSGTTLENLDPKTADSIFAEMVEKETGEGLGLSITAAEAKTFFKEYYPDFSVTVIDDPTTEEIKEYIAKGIPVIVPAAGRKLGNPFFTGEGPLYHMLVIRGYTEDGFITNDPGTRNGKNYTYKTSVLLNAIGDWNSGDPEHGAKRVLIMTPNK